VFTLTVSELLPELDINPLKSWLAVALLVATLTRIVLLMDTRRLLWGIERLTGLDLDRDGATGKPQERLVIVNAGQSHTEAEQQANAERASQFAQFVARLPAKGTAARKWEKELGRETHQEYRDALIKLGWARWKSIRADGTPNEKKGWALVLPAAKILRRISE
jgi:hypothetical protein